MRKTLLVLVVMLLLLGCSNPERSIAAVVNDEIIYVDEIELALKANNVNVSYNEVLRNSVNELLVIQMAKKDIDYTEESITSYINLYKANYPDLFQMGCASYGEKNYIEGLRRSYIYKRKKEKIQIEEISPVSISDDDCVRTLRDLDDAISFSELTLEDKEILYQLTKKKAEDDAFFDWIMTKWKENEIVVFYKSEDVCGNETS